MKILIVRMFAEELNINNYNCQEIGLAKALIRKGNSCDIVLFTNEKKSYEEDYTFDNNKRVHIYYLRAKKILNNCFFERKIFTIVRNYDVVQTAEYDQIANVKLKKYCKKMVIYHGPYNSNFTWKYNIKCLISDIYFLFHKSYKETLCISKSNLAEEFLRQKGFKNVFTIGVGLDLDKFKMKISNEKVSNIANSKSDFKYLLYIGTLEKRRNILFLIDILNKLRKNKIKLIIVGRGKKKYVNKCLEKICKYNLKEKIVYFDSLKQEELTDLYNCSDIFLLPTNYEIFGMVLLEALYFGLPVVTTINGGSSVLLNNDKYGLICENNNLSLWSEKIKRILSFTPNKAALRKYILKNYTWDVLVDKFLDVYSVKE